MKYLKFVFAFLIISCSNKATDTVSLIPPGYTGPVIINLCNGDGLDEKYENGKRVYEIDKNGLLTSKFDAEYGLQFNKYYYDTNKGRQEIRFLNFHDKFIKFDKDSVYVFGEKHSGTGIKTDSTGTSKTCPQITFYVGKYDSINKRIHELTWLSFEHQKNLKTE